MPMPLSRENAVVLIDELDDLVGAIEAGRAGEDAEERLERLVRSLEALPVADEGRLRRVLRNLEAWGVDLVETRDRSVTGPGSAADVVAADVASLRDMLDT